MSLTSLVLQILRKACLSDFIPVDWVATKNVIKAHGRSAMLLRINKGVFEGACAPWRWEKNAVLDRVHSD